MEFRFFEPPRETEIASKIRIVRRGINYTVFDLGLVNDFLSIIGRFKNLRVQEIEIPLYLILCLSISANILLICTTEVYYYHSKKKNYYHSGTPLIWSPVGPKN